MLKEVKNQFSNASKYGMPVFDQEMPRSVFMDYVRKGVEKLYARTEATLRNYRMYANILEQYLIKYGIEKIQPTESFIKEMWDRLKEDGQFPARDYEWATRKKAPRFTRKIINEFFHPTGLAQRDLIKEIAIQRYERIFKLTQNSQDAIKWFEKNGKRVEAKIVLIQNGDGEFDPNNHIQRMIHQITNRPLLPNTIDGKIVHAIRFLEYVNKRGFEEATKEDVDKFSEVCVQRGVKQVDDYLAHVATFYINIHSKGFIKSNPFAHVSLKMNGGAVRKDFITIEGMEKLRDLSTLDKSNKEDVRDRLFALLGYDMAMRIGEILSFKITDFKKDENGEWYVLIRPEIQKGSNKDSEIMYFFFDETKEVLDLYLKKIRDQFRPTTDFLIISNQWGRALSSDPCAARFKELCERLGVSTYHGSKPSPHLLRHSFATLNIEPLGMDIPLYEMSKRLRHANVETTRKHYIHNNPYLMRIKHEVLRKKAKKKTNRDIMNEMPLADIEFWLSEDVKVEASIIRHIRDKYKKAFLETPVDKKEEDTKIYIPEEEVLVRLKHLGIPVRALRDFALKNKGLHKDFQGTTRWGTGFRYKSELVEDLAQNWLPAGEVQTALEVCKAAFFKKVRSQKWRTIKIGRDRFIHCQDFGRSATRKSTFSQPESLHIN